MWMIRNSEGKKDLMATLMVVSFFVVVGKVILSGISFATGDLTVSVEPIGPELAAVLLGTNTAGYVMRRHTDRKFDGEPEETDDDGNPLREGDL